MMKKIKRLLSLATSLVLLLTLCLSIPTVAEEMTTSATPTGSITITNGLPGKTYKAYRILAATYDGTASYSYSVVPKDDEQDGAWYNFVYADDAGTLTETFAKYFTIKHSGAVSINSRADSVVMAFAQEALDYAATNNITPTQTAVAGEDGTVKFSNLKYGYYLIDSPRGSANMLDTVESDVSFAEKNTSPTLTKTVDKPVVNIGDTVTFTLTVQVGKGAQNYVIHDTMDKGLTLNATSFTYTHKSSVAPNAASDGSETQAETSSEEITTTEPETTLQIGTVSEPTPTAEGKTSFDITFDADFLKNTKETDEITVTYQATLNKDAVIGYYTDAPGNVNTSYLTYGTYSAGEEPNRTADASAVVYTSQVGLIKTNSNNGILTGAEFKLYDSDPTAAGAKAISFVKTTGADGLAHYRRAESTETGTVEIIEAGNVVIEGLAVSTFYLDEETAPEGYDPIPEAKAFSVTGDNLITLEGGAYVPTTSGGWQVVNYTGDELPDTGGIGTTIFYVIGAILVLLAVVLLVARRRMNVHNR